MRSSIEEITPAQAEAYLETALPNRPISETTVYRYATDMEGGRWEVNGQGLIFDPEGRLLDGQHRLHAVALSGKTTPFLIIRDIPPEAFKTIDAGKGRSLGDVLAMEGYTHYGALSSIARAAYFYIGGTTQSGSVRATRAVLEDFITKHPYMAEVANLLGRISGYPRGPMGAVLFLGNESRAYDDKLNQFLTGIRTGEDLRKGDPRLTFREWFINHRRADRGRTGNITGEQTLLVTARAWSAFVEDKPLAVIRMADPVTIRTVSIKGFDPSLYPEVPDLLALQREARVKSAHNNLHPAKEAQPNA